MDRTSSLTPDYGLYGEPAHPDFPDLVHIERLVERSGPRRWRISIHRHPALHQIFWIAEGGGVAFLDGTETPFSDRTALWLPAGAIHGFRFEPGTEGWVVTLPETVFAPVRKTLDPTRRLASAIIVPAKTVPPNLITLTDEHMGHQRLRGEALQAHLTLLLIWLTRQVDAANTSGGKVIGAETQLYERFLVLLDDAYARLNTVSAFADALAVSTPHLSRVCRHRTGRSASVLIRERRLLEARRLLAYTQVSVADIAHRLGYADPAHFARVFSKETGRSPRAFRKGFTDTSR